MYCKFGNFRENLIFASSIKRHICEVRNSRLGHDIPISGNGRVILPFREGFNFTKLAYAKFRENKTLAKISEFTVCNVIPVRPKQCWRFLYMYMYLLVSRSDSHVIY